MTAKRVCRFCGGEYINQGWHLENECPGPSTLTERAGEGRQPRGTGRTPEGSDVTSVRSVSAFRCVVDESAGLAERDQEPALIGGRSSAVTNRLESRSASPDPKPAKRVVDGTAEPLDHHPIDHNYCPLCNRFTGVRHRHHAVERSQGGDDLPENLAWLCSDCHRILHDFPAGSLVGRRFVRYCRVEVPELGVYADGKKWPGWLEKRYGDAA